MGYAKAYPLFCCLLCSNVIGGVGAIIIGAVLIDLSFYPESSVQFLQTFVDTKGQDLYLITDKMWDDAHEIKRNEGVLHLFLLVVGIICIIFGFIMIWIGLDIAYTLRSNRHSTCEVRKEPYSHELVSEMRTLRQKGRNATEEMMSKEGGMFKSEHGFRAW